MRLPSLVLLGAAFAFSAGDPAGFFVWKADTLRGYAKSLAPKMNEKKSASEVLTKVTNYRFQMGHREGPGYAEWHEKEADIFFVQSGEATLIYGGELVESRKTGEGQMVANSIRNGMEKKLAVGDVATIPAKIPHQLIIQSGKEFTYFVVKVDQ